MGPVEVGVHPRACSQIQRLVPFVEEPYSGERHLEVLDHRLRAALQNSAHVASPGELRPHVGLECPQTSTPGRHLLGPLALLDAVKEHRDPVRGGVDPYGDPDAEYGRDRLELGGLAVLQGFFRRPVALRAEGIGVHLAYFLPQKLPACRAQKLLRLAGDVDEAPLPVEGEEGVVDALQDPGRPLVGRALADEGEISLVLGVPALEELGEMAAHQPGRPHQVLVGRQDLAAEELEDPDEAPVDDGEGERPAQAVFGRGILARHVVVEEEVFDPHGLAPLPRPPRQPLAAPEDRLLARRL